MERSMMLMLSIHEPTKTVGRGPVLWNTLFTIFCLTFLKLNVAITYAFMGEICYLEKVTLSAYIRTEMHSLRRLRDGWVHLCSEYRLRVVIPGLPAGDFNYFSRRRKCFFLLPLPLGQGGTGTCPTPCVMLPG